MPTARGWATGQSFATISFAQNPGKDGQVLILAGANGEGTAAAGELITDGPRLSTALRNCGISSSNPTRHFQLLLRLNTMAGSPSNVDVLACQFRAIERSAMDERGSNGSPALSHDQPPWARGEGIIRYFCLTTFPVLASMKAI